MGLFSWHACVLFLLTTIISASHAASVDTDTLGCIAQLINADEGAELSTSDALQKEKSNTFVLELHEILQGLNIEHDLKTTNNDIYEIRIHPVQESPSDLGKLAYSLRNRLQTELYINPFHLYKVKAGAQFVYGMFPHRIYLSLAGIAQIAESFEPTSLDLHEIHHAYITRLWSTVPDGVFSEALFSQGDRNFRGLGIYNPGFFTDEISANALSIIAETAPLRRIEEKLRTGQKIKPAVWPALTQALDEVIGHASLKSVDATTARMSRRMRRYADFWIPKLNRINTTKIKHNSPSSIRFQYSNDTEIVVTTSTNSKRSKFLYVELNNASAKWSFILRGRHWRQLFNLTLTGHHDTRNFSETLSSALLKRITDIHMLTAQNLELFAVVSEKAEQIKALLETRPVPTKATQRQIQAELNSLRSLLARMYETSRNVVRNH